MEVPKCNHNTTDQLDDGVNIKEEVLEWLSELGKLDAQAKEIGPLVKRILASTPQ